MSMQRRAEQWIDGLNNQGWTVNEHMIDQFVRFAEQEVQLKLRTIDFEQAAKHNKGQQ